MSIEVTGVFKGVVFRWMVQGLRDSSFVLGVLLTFFRDGYLGFSSLRRFSSSCGFQGSMDGLKGCSESYWGFQGSRNSLTGCSGSCWDFQGSRSSLTYCSKSYWGVFKILGIV